VSLLERHLVWRIDENVAETDNHLFTRIVCLRALEAGAHLAERLDDFGAADFYVEQAARLNNTLEQFWATKPDGTGYYRAILTGFTGDELADTPTGLDCAFLLSVIHAFDRDYETSFRIDDPGVVSTLREYIRSFDGLYCINEGQKWTDGWAVGRYAEDVYDGVGDSVGNPCYVL